MKKCLLSTPLSAVFGVDIDDDAAGLGRRVAFIIGLVSVARVVCGSCSTPFCYNGGGDLILMMIKLS